MNDRVAPIERSTDDCSDALLPPERSQFIRRLASFGLGEMPDPLLTRARTPIKRGRDE